MKTLKINSVKMLVKISFVALLLLNACGPSGESNNAQPENNLPGKLAAETPKIDLQAAILSDNLEVVKQHIEAGTDINRKEQLSGASPLITAATFGKTSVARALIDANADFTVKNSEGATALHVAAFFCHVEIVQMLLDAGADKSVKNNFGATPWETVSAPFADVKPIYEMLGQQLEPMGLKVDLAEVEKKRPVIAIMLQ